MNKMLYGNHRLIQSLFISLFCITLQAQEKSTLLLSNALKFLDTPYVAHTLDQDSVENLVINCDEVDCTTFVEYALAMTLSPKQTNGDINENDFIAYVQKIRYRNGEINGYTSRLHYITEWIENGVKQGFLTDITSKKSPFVLSQDIHFMSSHPELYPQLAKSPENIEKIKKIESEISQKEIRYLPKDKFSINGLPWIQNGDILAITTNILGLDICHLGIAFYIQGKLCLLHASSSAKKVIVSRVALSQMMKMNQNWEGLRVLRIKN